MRDTETLDAALHARSDASFGATGGARASPILPPRAPQPDDEPTRGTFKAALIDRVQAYPFHMASLATMPLVAGIVAANGLFNLWRGTFGVDANVALSGALASLVGLVASLTVSSMKDGLESKKAAAASAAALAYLQRALEGLSHTVDRLAGEKAQMTLQLQDLHDVVSKLATRSGPSVQSQANTVECWGPLAPGSDYHSVAGMLWGDIRTRILPNGQTVLSVDIDRLTQAWLPRFRPGTAVQQANYVLYARKADLAPGRIADAIRYHLFAFRALKKIAAARGQTLLLERVRFAIRTGERPPMCFFVGEYLRGTSRLPFTASYCNAAVIFKVPPGLIDDRVITQFTPEIVEANRQHAQTIMMSEPTYTLGELEQRFGHLVEHPELDLTPDLSSGDGWVENGDHFG